MHTLIYICFLQELNLWIFSNFVYAFSGGTRISRRGCGNSREGCPNLLFRNHFAKIARKIWEFRQGTFVPSAPYWIRHCLTACTLWHRISFCRNAIGLPPVCQKLSNRIFAICLDTYSVKLSYKQAVLLSSLLNHGNHHLQSVLLSVDMYCSIDALIQSISMER